MLVSFFQGGIYEVFSGLTVVPMYQPTIPHGGPDQLGFGTLKDTFPAHREVNFHVTQTTGGHNEHYDGKLYTVHHSDDIIFCVSQIMMEVEPRV